VRSECDRTALAERGIPVLRRISGGGTVYHYPGNLNISVTVRPGRLLGAVHEAFAWLGEAIAAAVSRLGVLGGEARDRSVVVGGRKLSGAAQARRGDAVLVHGTLLVARDEILMSELLHAMREGYAPTGVPSRPSVTTTVSDELGYGVTMAQAADAVAMALNERVAATFGEELAEGSLSRAEAGEARRLEERKYRSREWNEGR